MNTADKVNFWKTGAVQSLKVAEDLFRLEHYLEALFFGHLAIEKLLKAKIVKATGSEPIYSHDLVILAKHAKLKLDEKDVDFLARVNVYNIRARYQDYKKSLYRSANKDFTTQELANIRKFFSRIK
mgnify:CR=1 FL=1